MKWKNQERGIARLGEMVRKRKNVGPPVADWRRIWIKGGISLVEGS
jgi:hypothetical protein